LVIKKEDPQPPKTSGLQRSKAWLLKRAANHRANLQLLIIGAGVFFIGAGTIVWADHNIPVSLKQELVGLGGDGAIGGRWNHRPDRLLEPKHPALAKIF